MSAPKQSKSASPGVAEYERRKWEIRYDWMLEMYVEGGGARGHWAKAISSPVPLDEVLKRLEKFRRGHNRRYNSRLRNVDTGEIICTEVIV